MITKEQVTEEAKKLGLALDDAKIGAYVLLGVLPKKEDTGTPPEDEEDDKDEKNLTKGMQERLKKEKEKRLIVEKERTDVLAKLKSFEEKERAAQLEKDKAKGNWEKINKDTLDAKAKAETLALAAKEKFRATSIRSKLESELLKAGCPADRLDKAVKLFDLPKIISSWTNEENLELEIEDFGSEVESFKKNNDFLFVKSEDDDTSASGYHGNTQPKGGSKTVVEKKREEIKKKFSQVFNS